MKCPFCGYEESKVELMREEYGKNEITHKKGDSIIKRLVEAFINPFTIILLILAIISFVTDIIMAEPSKKDGTSVIIVTSMVLISGILRFVQETKSNKAAEKLGEMVETTISVARKIEGVKEIPINEIVVGDIIHLAAGDMIPSDVRILKARDLFISQSSLTGESEPVEKISDSLLTDCKNPLDLENLAFMGSNVISGSAIAIAINVGDDTIFGSIAKDLSGKKEDTSFEKGVNSVSLVLIRLMLVMVPIVLFMNGFTKGDWMEAFLFAVSVAVGLTPEMLPMIVSANLAKGAVSMSKKKVIVKDLSAIQNFGAMDVLCTDKTGTITQDKVVLEYSLNVHGKEDTIITIQIDFALAERFDMTYIDKDGNKKRPYIIHRSSIGCYERTLAMLIEKYAGAFPTWLSPTQAIVLPISDKYNDYAESIVKDFKNAGIRIEGDYRAEKIGYKIREARLERIPYILVVGEKEAANNEVSVRSRKNGEEGAIPVSELKNRLILEIANKEK